SNGPVVRDSRILPPNLFEDHGRQLASQHTGRRIEDSTLVCERTTLVVDCPHGGKLVSGADDLIAFDRNEAIVGDRNHVRWSVRIILQREQPRGGIADSWQIAIARDRNQALRNIGETVHRYLVARKHVADPASAFDLPERRWIING